jgi:signal transduction histidine kinase
VIAEVVERSVKRVARRYKLGDDAFEITITEGLRIFSDPTALETVLNNLVDNAVKYSNRPAQVQVRASCDGSGNVSIEVHDSGIGIGASDVKRVFERFYRAPGEAVHSRRGTGLGLFVVASLIRNLGGKVRAYSDGANKGTRVQILLPSEEALSEVTNG